MTEGAVLSAAIGRTPRTEALFTGAVASPMLGLDLVCEKVDRLLVFQTLTMPGDAVHERTFGHDFNDRHVMQEPGWPVMAFLEHGFAGDPTNWWAPNHAGVEALLRTSGMRIKHKPGHEMYVCEPDPGRPSAAQTWCRDEFLSATGQRPLNGDDS